MKKLLLIFLTGFLLSGVSFVSAGLCKGSDGYYHECDWESDWRNSWNNHWKSWNDYNKWNININYDNFYNDHYNRDIYVKVILNNKIEYDNKRYYDISNYRNYDLVYNKGLKKSYNSGYDKGYYYGYHKGFKKGYELGYDDGWNKRDRKLIFEPRSAPEYYVYKLSGRDYYE